MDHAVALVETYLRMNGFFTVSEYPLIGRGADGWKPITDVDMMAVRFPKASEYAPAGMAHCTEGQDAALSVDPGRVHMLIAEVKEGRAELNRSAADCRVITTALARFGCCDADEASAVSRALLRDGSAITPCGHLVELAAFGTSQPEGRGRYRVILLSHVVEYIRSYVRKHWDILHVAQFKDPVFGLYVLERKMAPGGPNKESYTSTGTMTSGKGF